MPDKLHYQIALTFIPGAGDVLIKNLMGYCGSAEAVFKAPKAKLLRVPGIGEAVADAVIKSDALKQAEAELKFIEKQNITCLFYTDENYPKRLLHCDDAPVLLYYKGNATLNAERVIGIVGTRNATDYGKTFVKQLMSDLTTENVLVLSGLAYGIDTTAHSEALKNNLQTLAVLGHGLHTLYPSVNKLLSKKIMEHGGLLTEYNSQNKMVPSNFVNRNRIVAGMSDAVIVVETALKGGALITAQIANAYNRDVLALPGPVHATYSQGCNLLIKTNKAAMIENAGDLLQLMSWDAKPAGRQKQKALLIELSAEQKKIIGMLQSHNEVEIDRLQRETKLTSGELASALFDLEMQDAIIALPGKRYRMV